MTTSFAIGDEVFLKSGGEKMTIEKIDETDVSCVWFDKNKKVERNTFHAATLKKAPTPEERAAGMAAISRSLAR
ncbi:hypothetical protein AYM40_37770 (plasmid) [Paraburkholderia phytofirmans OLGA172]|uniref:DUF2158 domain-containing protein n=1 Tax=Paraburkholderia phytofirmans OLGA172 TaxID=1417228 RepID=A0A167WSL4_9BURK|nr:DUF2158 domain-containing protein [Paraburkholderia phytofirmans]ANB78118.1 hypothetical protein AYM40_37770 [Paraburkholderia phytofirmans OLGA172]